MKIRQLAIISLFSALVMLLTACGGGASADPLDGTSWQLMAYRKTSPIPGTVITAAFEDGQVTGSAGCNSYFGSYEVKGDTITVGPIAITEMYCAEPEGVMDQEATITAYLADAQTFTLSEDQLMIFQSEGEALTFIPQN